MSCYDVMMQLMSVVFLIIDVTKDTDNVVRPPQLSPSLASPSVSCCQALAPLGVYAMVSTMSLITWITWTASPVLLSQLMLLVHVVSSAD